MTISEKNRQKAEAIFAREIELNTLYFSRKGNCFYRYEDAQWDNNLYGYNSDAIETVQREQPVVEIKQESVDSPEEITNDTKTKK